LLDVIDDLSFVVIYISIFNFFSVGVLVTCGVYEKTDNLFKFTGNFEI